MDSNAELVPFIKDQISSGHTLEAVALELRTVGWTDEQISSAIYEYQASLSSVSPAAALTPATVIQPSTTFTPESFTVQPTVASPATTRSWPRRTMFAVLCIGQLVSLGGLFYVNNRVSNSTNAPTALFNDVTFSADDTDIDVVTDYKDFSDPNFTMKVPGLWQAANYIPAVSPVVYYSAEDATDTARIKAARLTVYVDPSSLASRIDEQFVSTSETTYEILKDETSEENGVRIRYAEILARDVAAPENVVRYATVTVQNGTFIIHADVVALNTYWNRHASAATTLLKSIRPACSAFAAEPTRTDGGAAVYCAAPSAPVSAP